SGSCGGWKVIAGKDSGPWQFFSKDWTRKNLRNKSSRASGKEICLMAKARPIIGLDTHAPTGRNARIIARIRLDELYDWSHYVGDLYHSRELHNLRIAAKRLRYTLEIFADVLPDACVSIVKELEMIQEELGALHDSDVMIALLRLCL